MEEKNKTGEQQLPEEITGADVLPETGEQPAGEAEAGIGQTEPEEEESDEDQEEIEQIERETAQIRAETAQIKQETAEIVAETEQIKKETAQIRAETEQIRRETAQIRADRERLYRENGGKDANEIEAETAQIQKETAKIQAENERIKKRIADIRADRARIQEKTAKLRAKNKRAEEENNAAQAEKSAGKRRKHPKAALGGAIFLVLALVGLVTVFFAGGRGLTHLLDHSKEAERMEQQLLPVLMLDPVPFDTVDDADPNLILQSAAWSALYSEKRDSYTYDDEGRMVIPASDIDVAAAKLFGPDVKVRHASFGDFDNIYTYDEENDVYRVPVMVQAGYYTPHIDPKDITKKGNDILEVKVGYLSPGAVWSEKVSEHKEPIPDKYMIYVLEEHKKDYYIKAIKDTGDANSHVEGTPMHK